jgi:hypothetical protein
MVQSPVNTFSRYSLNRTDKWEDFEHLVRFLLLVEPVIKDLKEKGFIK